MKSMPDCVSVFILPPSFEELEHRLRGRGTETEDRIEARLETAKRERRMRRSMIIKSSTAAILKKRIRSFAAYFSKARAELEKTTIPVLR